MLKLSSLKIDPEFSAQILPLSFEELQQLEMNMIRDGKLTDPIIVWNKTILDGHNRYNILRKHSFIEYEIKEMEFSSRQEALIWICNHQLGRAQPDTGAQKVSDWKAIRSGKADLAKPRQSVHIY